MDPSKSGRSRLLVVGVGLSPADTVLQWLPSRGVDSDPRFLGLCADGAAVQDVWGGAVQEPYKKMHAGECSLTHLMKGEAVSLPPRSQSWSTLSTYGWIPPRT